VIRRDVKELAVGNDAQTLKELHVKYARETDVKVWSSSIPALSSMTHLVENAR